MNLPLAVIIMLWTMGALSAIRVAANNPYFIEDDYVHIVTTGESRRLCPAKHLITDKAAKIFDIIPHDSTLTSGVYKVDDIRNQIGIYRALRDQDPILLQKGVREFLRIQVQYEQPIPRTTLQPWITELLQWPRLISRQKIEKGTNITVFYYVSPNRGNGFSSYEENEHWVTRTKLYEDSSLRDKLVKSYYKETKKVYLSTNPTGVVEKKCLQVLDVLPANGFKVAAYPKEELERLAGDLRQYWLKTAIQYTNVIVTELEAIPSDDAHPQSHEAMMQSRAENYFASLYLVPKFITVKDYSGKTVLYKAEPFDGSKPPSWKKFKQVECIEMSDEYYLRPDKIQRALQELSYLKIMESEESMPLKTKSPTPKKFTFTCLNHELYEKPKDTEHNDEIRTTIQSRLIKFPKESNINIHMDSLMDSLMGSLYVNFDKDEGEAGECTIENIAAANFDDMESVVGVALTHLGCTNPSVIRVSIDGRQVTVGDTNAPGEKVCIVIKAWTTISTSVKKIVNHVEKILSDFKKNGSPDCQAAQEPHNTQANQQMDGSRRRRTIP